jgi:hypothetical protein
MGAVGAVWGLAGVFFLIGSAVYRLSFVAYDAFAHPFGWHHWTSLVLVVVFMAFAEGYRGFQQRFSPRVAARARYLRNNPRTLHVMLAPLFCMGFFYATRRRKITSFSVTFGIVVLVVLVRFLSQPWRGIIDWGVVVGLFWGLVSMAAFSVSAFTRQEFPYSPEVPEEGEAG